MTDKMTLETDMIDENNNRQQQLEQWLQQVFLIRLCAARAVVGKYCDKLLRLGPW